jgi:putative flavoprotein involved in K+ transport
MYSSLPGMEMAGDKHGFPNKNEIALYLKTYVQKYELPIKLNTEVTSVSKKTFMIFRSQPRMKMGSLSHNVDTTNSEYMT